MDKSDKNIAISAGEHETIRSWKSTFESSAGSEALAPHPSGAVDLSDIESAMVGGGMPRITIGDACPILSISDCRDSVTWFSC